MEIFHQLTQNAGHLIQALNSVPADIWGIIIQIILSALVVSPLMLGLKKWFSINGEKLMTTLVSLGSLSAAALAYMGTDPHFAPWLIIVQGWLTYATTQPVYYLFVKPLFGRIGVWFADQISKATMIHEAKAAAVPTEGLPAITPVHDNFAD